MAKQSMKDWVSTVSLDGHDDWAIEVSAATAYMASTKAMTRYQKAFPGRVQVGKGQNFRCLSVQKEQSAR